MLRLLFFSTAVLFDIAIWFFPGGRPASPQGLAFSPLKQYSEDKSPKEAYGMEQQTFFERDGAQPLAARLRPRTLDEFVGQHHLLGPGKVLTPAD